MDSLHDFVTVHWDHEPTPDPSQEGNWHDADECLLPSWEGSGVGRFMESLDDSEIVHCGQETLALPRRKAPINRTHSKRFALPTESADHAPAFGVRASSAPLLQRTLRFDGAPPFAFAHALGP